MNKKEKDTESSVTAVLRAKTHNNEGGGRIIDERLNEKEYYYFGSGVREANKLVFFQGSTYHFDMEDLLRASAEVLGNGTNGTTYKAILEDGTSVAVKRLKEVVVGRREFEQHMENIGRIHHHRNVVSLLAYHYSKDEKLLVYDFLPFGSLSTLLHGIIHNIINRFFFFFFFFNYIYYYCCCC